MSSPPPPASIPSSVFHGYQGRSNAFDELLDGKSTRANWSSFVSMLNRIGPRDLQRRWEQAQRQIENDGVTFHPHGATGAATRPWTLDAIPLLVTEAEWKGVAAGLAQRAELLDLVIRDLFGPQHLLREKLLPAEFLYGHPSFHPALHQLTPTDRRHLQLYAADLARAPDGQWYVMGDRTRAPFGLGYALENRIVTSRMIPAVFRSCRVQRLARFFMRLQESLREMAIRNKDNPRIVLWTKGPSSPAYFEDSYLAGYLGYTLAEGDDLAVRENRVMLKTLGALLPVEVLFRRLDDDDCDPVELSAASRVGVSGLIEVLRAGNVATANALGTRLLEAPLLLAYLPEICERLLGQPLQMPMVRTHWCGNPESLKYVLDHFDDLMIRPAFREQDEHVTHVALLASAEKDVWRAKIKAHPNKFVAQEPIRRSTTPVWFEQQAVSWSLGVRAFLVASGPSFETMPGGLVRVSPNPEVLDQTMTAGERSQDLWIIASGPVDESSLLRAPGEAVELRRSGAELPSRVADNLFWLGRYVERAEANCRLLRTLLAILTSERGEPRNEDPLLRAAVEAGQIDPDYIVDGLRQQLPDVLEALPAAVFDRRLPLSLRSTIDEIFRLGSMVRDRVAIDMWRIIHRLNDACQLPEAFEGETKEADRSIDAAELLALLDELVTELIAFSGLASESMTRTLGWRFLDMGRRFERTRLTALLLKTTLGQVSDRESADLESVLRTLDSIMTYRSRYMATLQPAAVLDLLMTDGTNPRSLMYQLDQLVRHVDELPREANSPSLAQEQRHAKSLQHQVALADVFELAKVDDDGERPALLKLLDKILGLLPKLADEVSGRFLIHAGLQRHYSSAQTQRGDAK